MGKKRQGGWRDKIDPAFDEAIRAFVSVLNLYASLPNDGHFALDEEAIQLVSSPPPKAKILETLKDNVGKMLGIEFGLFEARPCDHAAAINYLDSLLLRCAEGLPPISRNYYVNAISVYKNKCSQLPLEDVQHYCGNSPLLISLTFRHALMGVDELMTQCEAEGDGQLNSEPEELFVGLAAIYDTFSQIAYQITSADLLRQIDSGVDEAIFKAVTVDKTLLLNDAVKRRIIKAQLSGDTAFFRKLGNAIARAPLERTAEHFMAYSVLKTFWPILGTQLKYEEIYYLLLDSGLRPPDFPDAFYKFIKRHIKSSMTMRDNLDKK